MIACFAGGGCTFLAGGGGFGLPSAGSGFGDQPVWVSRACRSDSRSPVGRGSGATRSTRRNAGRGVVGVRSGPCPTDASPVDSTPRGVVEARKRMDDVDLVDEGLTPVGSRCPGRSPDATSPSGWIRVAAGMVCAGVSVRPVCGAFGGTGGTGGPGCAGFSVAPVPGGREAAAVVDATPGVPVSCDGARPPAAAARTSCSGESTSIENQSGSRAATYSASAGSVPASRGSVARAASEWAGAGARARARLRTRAAIATSACRARRRIPRTDTGARPSGIPRTGPLHRLVAQTELLDVHLTGGRPEVRADPSHRERVEEVPLHDRRRAP